MLLGYYKKWFTMNHKTKNESVSLKLLSWLLLFWCKDNDNLKFSLKILIKVRQTFYFNYYLITHVPT